jgi:hypothetical protein
MIDTTVALVLLISNVIMLFVGFMIGDEAHHDEVDILEEDSFDRHAQSAMWVARRSL